jgi:hypothetical protein
MLAAQNNSPGSTLLQRATQLGQATENAAIQFVDNFAQSLFGSAANNLQLSITSGQLSASSSLSNTTQATNGGQSRSSSASSVLQDSSEFTGTGTMVTSDGQRFTFQVDVQLQAVEQISTNTLSTGTASSSSFNNNVDPFSQTLNIPVGANAQTPDSANTPSSASTSTPASTATPTSSAGKSLSNAIQFPSSLENFLSLLNHGGFNQPIQLNSVGSATASESATQSGVLNFSLLNQLPPAGTLNAPKLGA